MKSRFLAPFSEELVVVDGSAEFKSSEVERVPGVEVVAPSFSDSVATIRENLRSMRVPLENL